MYYMVMRYNSGRGEWEMTALHQTSAEAIKDYEEWLVYEPHGKFRLAECRNMAVHQ